MIIALALLSHLIITILADVNVYNNDSNKLLESFDDQNARFGPALSVAGVKGYLMTTNPLNACQPVSPPPFPVKEPYHWIAIIPRTNGPDSCEFVTKVQNAQAANFSAVIIYNFEDAIIPMGSSSKTVRIPSTMITHTDGLSLITHYLYNKTSSNGTSRYYVKIVPEPPYKFGPYVIVAVVIVSVSFLVLIGSMLVRCHIQRRHTRRHRLPRSALKQLKIKKFAKTDPWEVCVICLDDFVEGAKLRILPCNHAYHVKCIDPWLINNRRQCPVCKRYVFPNLDQSDDDESNNRPRPNVSNEHTPLIHGDNVQSTTERPANRRFPRHTMVYPTAASVHASLLSSSDSSESIPSLSSSLRPTTMSAASSQQPLSISRQYGSFNESATTGVHHPILSSMEATVEDVSDVETGGDDDSRTYSVLADSGENPAYVTDEETTNTHL